MQLTTWICAALLAMPAVVCAVETAGSSSAPAAGVAPIHSRQNVFAIPFRVNRTEEAQHAPTAVFLYASTDQGKQWQLVNQINPDVGQFTFSAAQDGEYWFSLRTLDRNGKKHPEGEHQPGLRVVVDTTAPRLQLAARQGPSGEVQLNWQAVDRNLQADSLNIDFQVEPGQPWKSLDLGQQRADSSQSTRIGKANWWPNVQQGKVTLRAAVADRAGNRTVSHTVLTLGNTPAAGSNDTTAQQGPAVPGIAVPGNTDTAADPRTSPAGAAPSGPQRWQPNLTSQHALGSQPNVAPTNPNTPAQTVESQRQNDGPQASSRYASYGSAPPAAKPRGDRYAGTTTNNPARQIEPSYRPQPQPPAHSGAPPTTVPVTLNSLRFAWQYNLVTGPASVARVELWGTADGGRSWSVYAVDPDRQSPVVAEVPQPGLYGFRIVVHDANGLSAGIPRPGDAPEMWARVNPPQTPNPTPSR